ncbi:MAG: septum formation protein Maf [bacterium]|nr:septum formation protein Maf [bacterium]
MLTLDRPLYLASKSPRRRELLRNLGLDFEILDNDIEERVDGKLEPGDFVVRIAEMKARNILENVSNGYIITADTIVFLNGRILEKPSDRDDAYRMLNLLQGNTHQVYTGLAVSSCPEYDIISGFEKTDVTFAEMTVDEICRYLDTEEYKDKAGAYAIQGKASVFIQGINGCYFNVVGLPLRKLYCILSEMKK